MKFPLFEDPAFRYELDDWDFKKNHFLVELINKNS